MGRGVVGGGWGAGVGWGGAGLLLSGLSILVRETSPKRHLLLTWTPTLRSTRSIDAGPTDPSIPPIDLRGAAAPSAPSSARRSWAPAPRTPTPRSWAAPGAPICPGTSESSARLQRRGEAGEEGGGGVGKRTRFQGLGEKGRIFGGDSLIGLVSRGNKGKLTNFEVALFGM